MDKKLGQLRHSTAHLFAAAVLDLRPDTKLTIGPAIESGFYYDLDLKNPLTDDDLEKIEKKMKEILPSFDRFTSREVSADEAKEFYKENEYKKELIDEIVAKGEKITFYKAGNFEDLCRGGHSENPKEDIGAFKLLSIAGAYWRGSEKNKMLTRVYGTAFSTQKELDDYLMFLEEAKKRDHRKIGKELDLFVFSDLVGGGLPLFTPRGTIVRQELLNYSEKLQKAAGYQSVWIPHITKVDLYKTSGHFDKFGSELFLVKSQETDDEFVLKPMNCPHHTQIYASKIRSYRDLPVRYMENTVQYRDEKAGELLGLSRVRSISIDDAHIFCTPDQVEHEFELIMNMIKDMYTALDMKFKARLSFRDSSDKYLGKKEDWENAQKVIEDVAKKLELDYFVAEGEAAFYGPKIDIMVVDALGREWQCATQQLDFVQPQRFGLTYIDAEGKERTPFMIHKALLGSIERFLAVFIEHTMGKFPVWLSPVQIELLPIADRHAEFAHKVALELRSAAIRVEVNDRPGTLQSKIREATLQRTPFMGIIGDKEIAENAVSVRSRDGEDLGVLSLSLFLQKVREDIDKKR